MGNDNSKYIYDISEDSSESESDYALEERPSSNAVGFRYTGTINANLIDGEISENDRDEIDLTTDASANSYRYINLETVLTIDKVYQIEKDLDDYEIVSLVYLLYEDARYALQELLLLLRGAKKNLLYNWAISENNSGKQWQKKIVEALCVIKNYKILSDMGYRKEDLIADFLPQSVCSITLLNKVRKAIYLICEKLDKKKTEEFLSRIKSQFLEKKLPFDMYDSEFLELYVLKWETISFVTLADMSNIKKALKLMNEDYLYDMLDNVLPQVVPNTTRKPQRHETYQTDEEQKQLLQIGRPSTSTDTQQNPATKDVQLLQVLPQYIGQEDYQFSPPCLWQENSLQPLIGQDNVNMYCLDDNRYEVDPKNPGTLLIINQIDFYTEFEEKYKNLLPDDTTIKLDARKGTEKDQDDLENIFSKFGFKVISVVNLKHGDMLDKIREVVKSIQKESSLFVCIMSHGEKGVVYGSDSCKVKVSKIQEIMCKINKEHLKDKPKFLILQSCQGKECLKINEESEEDENAEGASALTTDGPKSAPRMVDLLTFWATYPGYAAIRNKRTGSWFIQALCEKMKELGNRHHFLDICTRILSSVSGKTWVVQGYDKNTMLPFLESTLRKDFFLPKIKT